MCILKEHFDEKHKVGEILFQEDGTVSINELPFPKHNNKGKDYVMMASHVEGDVAMHVKRDVEGELAMQP